MNAETWSKVSTLIDAARMLPPAERMAYLEAHETDPAIREEVLSLLGYTGDASAIFAEMPQWALEAPAPEPDRIGVTIGRYRLLRLLGRGGMGAVYLAERADGTYQQQVALKILQESVLSPRLVDRFATERQILARLTHAGIAHLLDGGITADGQPYLVLEYVDGEPVDRYCDEQLLTLEQRLRLFLRIAAAVQSAHQQLVLHLDIKPGNILVTRDGEPKLLDFGIARVVSEGLGTSTAEQTTRLLTPRYASPEQADGRPLGVASDVFSMTTLLYRLLTGRLPYDFGDASPLETARILCNTPPMLASHAAPPELRPQLRGDLDTILAKGLRKEPERRYPTVAALAEDIGRYLDSLPVLAHADSFRYRASKFLRRNRTAVTVGCIVALVLAVSIGAVVRFAIIARQQRAVAERRLKDVRSLAHSYVFDLDPKLEQLPGSAPTRKFVLDNALKYLDAMSRESGNDDDVARELATGYNLTGQVQDSPGIPSLHDPAGAYQSMTRGIAIQEQLVKRHPGDLKELGSLMGQMRHRATLPDATGDMVLEQKLLQETWDVGQPLLEHPEQRKFLDMAGVASSMADVYTGNADLWNLCDPLAAAPWVDRVLPIVQRYLAAHPKETLNPAVLAATERYYVGRAQIRMQTGQEAEARADYETALQSSAKNHGELAEDVSRWYFQEYYAAYLITMHDVRGAEAAAPKPHLTEHHDGDDLTTSADDADFETVLARIDFEAGRMSSGREHMRRGLDSMEALYRKASDDANLSSELAWDNFHLAEEDALAPALREQMYQRAMVVADRFYAAHPGVLSAVMLRGRSLLGLANLAHHRNDIASQRKLAAAAQDCFRQIIAAHPNQPQAIALTAQAGKLL